MKLSIQNIILEWPLCGVDFYLETISSTSSIVPLANYRVISKHSGSFLTFHREILIDTHTLFDSTEEVFKKGLPFDEFWCNVTLNYGWKSVQKLHRRRNFCTLFQPSFNGIMPFWGVSGWFRLLFGELKSARNPKKA